MADFCDTWGPVWEVQKTIPQARKYIIENTGKTFRSGRPIVDAVFFDSNRQEVCRRTGMRLTSKRGIEYAVCRRDPETTTLAPVPSTRHDVETESRYTPDDVFED